MSKSRLLQTEIAGTLVELPELKKPITIAIATPIPLFNQLNSHNCGCLVERVNESREREGVYMCRFNSNFLHVRTNRTGGLLSFCGISCLEKHSRLIEQDECKIREGHSAPQVILPT